MISDEALAVLEAAAETKEGDVRFTKGLSKYHLLAGNKEWNVPAEKMPTYLMMFDDLDKKELLTLIRANIKNRHGRLVVDDHWYRITQDGRDYVTNHKKSD